MYMHSCDLTVHSAAFVRLTDDIDAAITEMLLVQTDKSLKDLKEMTPRALESFKQSFIKLKDLKSAIVDKCMAACAILPNTSGKSKKEKIDFLFKHHI